MPQPVVILSTCGSIEAADRIAVSLVEKHLAACVSFIEGAKSTYRWQGKVSKENEILLVIKTVAGRTEEIKRVLKEISGYEVPEVICIDITGGSKEYIDWLIAETK